MKSGKKLYISTQLVLALAILFGLNNNAHAERVKKSTKYNYKVEKCDCMVFEADDPTFLSDMAGTDSLDIWGEGKSRSEAEAKAQNMCVEVYRSYASVASVSNADKVSHTSCHVFRSMNDGDWEAI